MIGIFNWQRNIYVSHNRFEINQNQISGQQWGIFQAHFLLTKTKTPFHLSRNPKVFFNQFKKHGHSYIVGFHSAGLTVLSIICRERFLRKSELRLKFCGSSWSRFAFWNKQFSRLLFPLFIQATSQTWTQTFKIRIFLLANTNTSFGLWIVLIHALEYKV